MTVQELIEQLQQLPPDADVYRIDGEYKDSTSKVGSVKYHKDHSFEHAGNAVVLS